tara:strand:+ start:1027 stop:1158 length:132 start_codon:yes stop_codon:yes gene_type:complete
MGLQFGYRKILKKGNPQTAAMLKAVEPPPIEGKRLFELYSLNG